MYSNNIAIVVIAYNRPHSLSRLLKSLNQAEYGDDNVELIISIDKSDNDNVANIAKDFIWSFGDKQVIQHKVNLGLRAHVLKAGDLSLNYDAIIVLEDDLIVSNSFYTYAKEAVSFYEYDSNIAGISLYSHKWNFNAGVEFTPLSNGSDTFFMQVAQSWGQIYTKEMWRKFREWYNDNNGNLNFNRDLPSNIAKWPETSWLKYYMKYIIDNNKYFVYPYESLTTNFTDDGTHHNGNGGVFQVPLTYGVKNNFRFSKLSDSTAIYDIFFENKIIGKYININHEELCVDLYRSKGNKKEKRYWLTTSTEDYKILDSFGLSLKPHEMNVIYSHKGQGIYLYDTSTTEKFYDNRREINNKRIRYIIGNYSKKYLLKILCYESYVKLKSLIIKEGKKT